MSMERHGTFPGDAPASYDQRAKFGPDALRGKSAGDAMGALDAGVRRAGTGGSCDAKIARARSERFAMASAIDGLGEDRGDTESVEC
jgi:hypothetical protein